MRTLFQVALVVFGVVSVAIAQASVPFVGCPADGQQGPVVAPSGRPRVVALPTDIASKLAWYETSEDGGSLGVLAPRGWHCFGTYGSNGSSLYVAPEPLDADIVLLHKNWNGFTGPAIQLSLSIGDTSGRFEVARVVARVFPVYRAYARKIIAEGFGPRSAYPFGPFPSDHLEYRSTKLVEFTTPARCKGLGTVSWLLPSDQPIIGFSRLSIGENIDTELLQMNVRLLPSMQALARALVRYGEN